VTSVYVFGGIMAILVAAVIFAPLVEGRRRGGEGVPDSAGQRKEHAIEALRELEFEYQTGKVSEEDYGRLRSRYAREALAARDELGETIEAGACATCGSSVKDGAKFCSRCGAQLS
jgi:hypothetical protein